jgi:D-lactate dehydrogenase
MLDVYFYEAFAEEADELRRLLPARITAGYTDRTIQEASHTAPPARLLSVRTQAVIPLDWAPAIGGILSRSTGFDHLVAYSRLAAGYPIQYGHLPLYCHRAVAEQAMMLWMALLRKLPRQVRQFREFNRDGLTGPECQGKTLAVFGVGNIGREVCRIGVALEMKVLGVDRKPIHAEVEYATIEQALAQVDVIVCAMDLNDSNFDYFDAAKWAQVKPGTLFVNISRGEISPSTALVAALDSGQLGGAGLDVYAHEPELAVALRTGARPADAEALAALELARRENVICTPHNAFNSTEAVHRKSLHSVQQIEAFLATGEFLWPAHLAPGQ